MSSKSIPKGLFILLVIALFFVSVIASFAETVYYAYDDLNRLVYVLYGDGSGIDYIYDEVGNREQKVTSQLKDSDNDGMPDSFEIYYGLNPYDPTDAGSHNDSDGLTNLQEYQLGTNPLNPDTDGDGRIDSADTCPTYPPARIAGAYYSTLLDAYNTALNGEIIRSQAVVFTEDLNINLNKSITLLGGYDCSYTSITGMTSIKGQMTISSGEVTVKDFILEK